MDMAKTIIFGSVVVILFFVLFKLYRDEKTNPLTYTVKFMSRVAIFSAISALFYIFIRFPVPFLPPFLEFHFDEIPIFIAGFAYGPFSAFCIIVLKTVIKLPFTTTACLGELGDLFYSLVFILPASILYSRKRNFKMSIFGMLIGMLLQLILSLLGNVYILVPVYLGTKIDISYGLATFLPFNAIKDGVVIIVTILTYKATHKFFDKKTTE